MGKMIEKWISDAGYMPIEDHLKALDAERMWANDRLNVLGDLLAAKTLELETLKNKIVERAQTPSTIKAKSAAEIRSLMERQAEREFEEANG